MRRTTPPPGEDADATARRLRAIARARKLLRLAEDQEGQPEGRAALAAAETLLAAHGLTRGTLGLGEGGTDFRQRAVDLGRAEAWRLTLVHAVADGFDCVALHRKGDTGVELFGPEHALPLVEHAFAVYLRTLQQRWRAHVGALEEDAIWSAMSKPTQLQARESFCVSFVLGVKERLESERREELAADAAGRAASGKQRRDLEVWMRKAGVRWQARPRGVGTLSSEGYKAGYETEIDPALKGGSGPRRLGG